MPKLQENELHPSLLASGAINPFTKHTSSSRQQMLGGHLSQALVIAGATPRRCMTGVEREFGRFTFNVKMPVDAEILKVIQKYPRTHGEGGIQQNPLVSIIYDDVATKEVGVLHLPRFSCKHQHFGFNYRFKPAAARLSPGMTMAKGTVLAESPAVDDQGNYSIGTETNVAFMSVPGVIEDGVIVSKAYVQKLKTRGFENRVGMWGAKYYPLNLYGDERHYKPFPDIGERIRDDGLLFALRRYDDMLAPVEMTPKALMEPDSTFDYLIYGKPNALVTDVHIRHEVKGGFPRTPERMEEQTYKYYRAQVHYYENLLAAYKELRTRRGPGLRITPEFHRLLVEAQTYTESGKNKATMMVQRQPLDEWRVEVSYEYDIVPGVGYKLTDFHGGKGVICDVWETEDMPIDAEGNRAECIMDGDSTIKRMNIGRLYEQYINATSRHVTNQVRKWMENPTQENIEQAWNYVTGYYAITSPKMYNLITGPDYTEQPRYHLENVKKDGVYLWMPTDNPADSITMIQELRQHYPIQLGPVVYRGRSGNVVTTVSNVLIGSIYVMLLEKTGDDWSGVSSCKLQHFGIPARLTKHDKHSLPGRANPVRIMGESEVRLVAAAVGGDVAAELLEMSNSPATHKHIVANILRAERPTDIDVVVDRKVAPRGGSRALVYVNHALECAGVSFYQQDDVDDLSQVYLPEVSDLTEDLQSRLQRIPDEDEVYVEPEEVEPEEVPAAADDEDED